MVLVNLFVVKVVRFHRMAIRVLQVALVRDLVLLVAEVQGEVGAVEVSLILPLVVVVAVAAVAVVVAVAAIMVLV